MRMLDYKNQCTACEYPQFGLDTLDPKVLCDACVKKHEALMKKIT